MVSDELVRWLANGRRGISSNAIVTHLTGIDADGRYGWPGDHPHDPDDLWRCRLLLEQVPELRHELPRMASRSGVWAELVEHWQELCDLMDAEAPEWYSGKGSAPRTYALMKRLIRKGEQAEKQEK